MEMRYVVRTVSPQGPHSVYDTLRGQLAWVMKESLENAQAVCADLNAADAERRERQEAVSAAAVEVRTLIARQERRARTYEETANNSWRMELNAEARREEEEAARSHLVVQGLRHMLRTVGESTD